MASSPTKKEPLAERSPNTTSPTKSSSPPSKSHSPTRIVGDKPLATTSSGPQSRADILAQQQSHSGATGTYISPSDTILSPTTQKLRDIKGRRFASVKPQSLFTKTVGRVQAQKEKDGPTYMISKDDADRMDAKN